MVKAGDAVDQMIDQLVPHLEKGDIIIDGGNSLFTDSNRRTKDLADKGHSLHRHRRLRRRRRRALRPVDHARRQSRGVAAREGDLPVHRRQGRRRHALLRLGGRRRRRPLRQDGPQRHRVRRHAAHLRGLPAAQGRPRPHAPTSCTTSSPSGTRASSTATSSRSPRTSSPRRTKTATPLVDKILDTAGQKGTGKWTAISALDLGHAGHAHRRERSSRAAFRAQGRARRRLQGPARARSQSRPSATAAEFIEDVRRALYCSKIISYAQGYMLLRAAAKEYELEPQHGRHRADVARRLHHPQPLPRQHQGSLRQESRTSTICCSTTSSPSALNKYQAGRGARPSSTPSRSACPTPAFSTALAFFDGYRTERLPANLLQAQRDFFGAHTYERVDKPRGEFFHTNWTGRGGRVSSTTYNA